MLPFVRQHSPTILADLRREYGIDLLDLWRGRLSFYELCCYLSGMPAESSTGRLMRDAPQETEGWGLVPQLLGAMVDALRNQWAEKPVDSVIPKALREGSGTPDSTKPELQPDSAVASMFGSTDHFVATHAGK